MHIADPFPRILGRENPAVGHTEDNRWVVQLMQTHAKAIDAAVHCREHAVVDIQPTLFMLDRRSTGTDLHLVPVIGHRFHNHLGIAPVDQIRRVFAPDRPRANIRVRPVQLNIPAVDLFREDDRIAIVGLCDKRDSLDIDKISRLGKPDPHAMLRIGTVSNVIRPIQRINPRVFDAKRLVHSEIALFGRSHERFGINGKVKPIIANRLTDDRTPRIQMRAKQHNILTVKLDHTRIMDGFHFIRHIRFRQNRITLISCYKFFSHYRIPFLTCHPGL